MCCGGHFAAQFIINAVTYMFTHLSGTANFFGLHSVPGNLSVWPVCRQLCSNALSATLTVGNTIPLIVRALYWGLLTKVIQTLLMEEQYQYHVSLHPNHFSAIAGICWDIEISSMSVIVIPLASTDHPQTWYLLCRKTVFLFSTMKEFSLPVPFYRWETV